jgi:hypothetical protein
MAEQQLNVFERSAPLKHLNGKRVAPFVSARAALPDEVVVNGLLDALEGIRLRRSATDT